MRITNSFPQVPSTDGNLKHMVLVENFSIPYRTKGSLPFLKSIPLYSTLSELTQVYKRKPL